MKFEIGKYYRHGATGKKISVLGKLTTTLWKECLVGETSESRLEPLGSDDGATINYREITKQEWMEGFSK